MMTYILAPRMIMCTYHRRLRSLGFVNLIELRKSSVLMVLYAVFGFDRNLSRSFGFG